MPQAHGRDRIFPSGEPAGWILEAPESKGWIARRSPAANAVIHPGTAVRWEEQIYEVVGHEVISPERHRYRLSPWEERLTIRTIEPYDEQSEVERQEGRRHHAGLRRTRRAILLLAPLVGHLPAGEQERLEREYDVSATFLTVASAFPLFFFGSIAAVWLTIMGFTGVASPVPMGVLFLGVYLFLESGMRLASAIPGSRPAGSLLGSAAFALWRSIRRIREPGDRPAAAPVRPGGPSDRNDRYFFLKPYLSFLPESDQAVLIDRFGFEAIRWGKIMASVVLAVAGLNLLLSLSTLSVHQGGLGELLWAAGSAFFVFEQVARLLRLARGSPSGSVLGRLVRPLAASLLRSAPESP